MAERTRTTGKRAAAGHGSGKAGEARAGTRRTGSAARAAAERAIEEAAALTRPERLVVEQPRPDPDYPRYRVEPGSRLRLADVDPEESEHYRRKKDVADALERQRERIADLQARLYAEQRRSLLIVLQAMDTGGKDSTIKGVFQGVNPQGCQVWSFKAPSNEEADHDFLWRYHQKVPPRGMITIFNRSHYEDVLIVRVNPARALVRDPRQQEVVPQPGGRADHRRHPGGHGPALPTRRAGPGQGRGPRLSQGAGGLRRRVTGIPRGARRDRPAVLAVPDGVRGAGRRGAEHRDGAADRQGHHHRARAAPR